MAARSMELKPAVRMVTDWKKALSSLLPAPAPSAARVAGLFHSISAKHTVPKIKSPPLTDSTTLACRESSRQRLCRLMTSSTTEKPSPPSTISMLTVSSTRGSSRKEVRLE